VGVDVCEQLDEREVDSIPPHAAVPDREEIRCGRNGNGDRSDTLAVLFDALPRSTTSNDAHVTLPSGLRASRHITSPSPRTGGRVQGEVHGRGAEDREQRYHPQ
jgi:hypothetical protein